MIRQYGSVTLNSDEKILLQCTADIPRKFRHKGHKDDYGFEFEVTEFMLNYYSKEIIELQKKIDKLKDKRRRWLTLYSQEIWPDL